MIKKKQNTNLSEEVRDLIKKLLILKLFDLNVPQEEIAKKLKIDVHAVNDFLKGLKRKK